MFRKKPKKSQSDKTPFTVFEIHSRPLEDRTKIWTQGYYQVVSIDPAWKNFAIRISRRYSDGKIDPPLLFAKYDFTLADKARDDTKDCVFLGYGASLVQFQQWLPLLRESHIIMIERQIPENYKATRMMQHALSFFMTHLRDMPLMPMIMEVDPQLKGKMLGAPKGCRGTDLKNWAVEKALEILTVRDDQVSLAILAKNKRKMDDLSDTVVQEEAWFLYNGLPTTPLPPRNACYDPIVPPIASRAPGVASTGSTSSRSMAQFFNQHAPTQTSTPVSTPKSTPILRLKMVPTIPLSVDADDDLDLDPNFTLAWPSIPTRTLRPITPLPPSISGISTKLRIRPSLT
jgi:hypothetical protein